MDRFGRSTLRRGPRGPSGLDGIDLLTILPRSTTHLLNTVEFDASFSVQSEKDLKIFNVAGRREVLMWFSRSNHNVQLRALAGSDPPTYEKPGYGVHFPLSLSAAMKLQELTLFSTAHGVLCISFNTLSDQEQTLLVTSKLMREEASLVHHVREIRLTSKQISIHGFHSEEETFVQIIPVDVKQWTTLLLVWSRGDTHDEFTATVNNSHVKHYFSLMRYKVQFPGIILGCSPADDPDTRYFHGNIRYLAIWHPPETPHEQILHNIVVSAQKNQ